MRVDGAVILSPFSNSPIRDWPARSYTTLLGLLLDEAPAEIIFSVIGTQSQVLMGDEIVRGLDTVRVSNDCGRHSWPQVECLLSQARCVIGNNSGIVHLAARLGVSTVCIFGGSHQRAEWRPVGANVALISRAIWCSPCHLTRLTECRYGKACLQDIDPQDVAAAVLAMLGAEQNED